MSSRFLKGFSSTSFAFLICAFVGDAATTGAGLGASLVLPTPLAADFLSLSLTSDLAPLSGAGV